MTAQNWIPSTAGPTGNGARVGLGFDLPPAESGSANTQPGNSFGLSFADGSLIEYDSAGRPLR